MVKNHLRILIQQMIQNIFPIGANGNVGSKLVRQIFYRGDTNSRLHSNPTRIVGLASINEFDYNPRGISRRTCINFADKKQGHGSYDLNDILEAVKKEPLDNLTFVDVTASKEPMRQFHIRVIDETPYGIVASNKNPLTMINSEEFRGLVGHTNRYGFRCSIMAGANAIDELLDFRDAGDRVRSIVGCFSGTLGYICNQLQKGITLSEAVRQARAKSYTEPHPRDDLSGEDVAKKLLILARTAGFNVDMKDIQRTPFIPQEFLEFSDPNIFMENISQLNNHFRILIEKAKAEGKVLRYVADLHEHEGSAHLKVGPQLVPYDSELGYLKGTLNKIVIKTMTYTKGKPCIIEAPGAGLRVTAQNVRRDLLKQIENRKVSYV